jgi:hypothetical protein
VNTTLGTLVIGGQSGDIVLSSGGTGSTGNFGAISGSGLDITGNANIAGNLTLGGAITIGDASVDTVNVVASLSSSLIPQTTNAFDLGSATKIWRDLYISTGSIKFVEGTSVVKTLTAATLTALEAATGSSNTSITNLNSTTASLNTSVTNINDKTGSYATTGSNQFNGNQTITGSLTIYNGTLNVSGSIQTNEKAIFRNSAGTALEVSGGIDINNGFSYPVTIKDNLVVSGSVTLGNSTASTIAVSGSLNVNNKAIFASQYGVGNALEITGGVEINNGVSYPVVIKDNFIVSGSTILGDSSSDLIEISGSLKTNQKATFVSPYGVGNALEITGGVEINNGVSYPVVIKDNLVVSGSILGSNITGSNIVATTGIYGNIYATNGIVSGSSQITYASISSIPAGIVSGSSQITYASISSIPAGIVSGSSQVTGIGNAQLTNSSTTIGTTAIALGASSTTLAGLTSVTSTAFVGALTGNASTVTTNANLTGNVTSVGNATTIASGVVTSDMIVDGTIVNGDINASAAIVDTKLATIATAGKVSNSATTATSANTVSAIVTRDASGNFAAGTITAALTGNASTATTAAALTNARTINGTSFDGSANITIPNLVSGSAQVTLSSTTGGTTSSNVQFNSLGIGMAASATAGRIDATNDVVAFSSSDIRFKENIVPIENALDKISKISGNTYDWKAENKIEHGYEGNDVGVIAQEIEAVLPQLVQTRENGFKAVKYDKLVALLIEGIKEQQTQIEKLRMDLDNYECKCDNCKSE